MGASLKGKNLLPEGANSFLHEQLLIAWKITSTTLGDLPSMLLFITHVRNCVMGATIMFGIAVIYCLTSISSQFYLNVR